MKTCEYCSERLLKLKRKDSRFCDDACRQRAKRALRVCTQCRMHHPSVGAPDYRCATCVVHEKVVLEKADFRQVVTWMFEHHTCFYCGEYATEKEHVVPQHTLYPTWIVPACHECNAMAGATIFVSVLDKHQWLQTRRGARYSKLLKMPDWDWEEISELGRNLRAKVEAAQKAKDVVKSQLIWNPLALREMVR